MKARFSITIGVTALFILFASFAYGQQTPLSMFKQTSFAPGSMPMGAEIPGPVVLILQYGQFREKRIFSVGEPLNIRIHNVTGGDIYYVRRRPPGVDSVLLENESIRIQRLVNGKWSESSDNYSILFDDPDDQYGPQLKKIGYDLHILRRWTPSKPGHYRVKLLFFTYPNTADGHTAYSKEFYVDPE